MDSSSSLEFWYFSDMPYNVPKMNEIGETEQFIVFHGLDFS